MAERLQTLAKRKRKALPASELKPKQQSLIDNMIQHGMSVSKAAEAAGVNRNTAYRWLREKHVRLALVERTSDAVVNLAPLAAKVMRDLLTTSQSDYVRLSAAQDIANRVFGKPVERRQVSHEGRLSVRIGLTTDATQGKGVEKPMVPRNSTPSRTIFPSGSEVVLEPEMDIPSAFAMNDNSPSMPGGIRDEKE